MDTHARPQTMAEVSAVRYRGAMKPTGNFVRGVAAGSLVCAMAAGLLSACAGASGAAGSVGRAPPPSYPTAPGPAALDPAGVLDRLSWGATSSDYEQLRAQGTANWIAEQLRGDDRAALPPAIQAQIAAMTIERTPLPELIFGLEAQRNSADALADDEAKKAAQHDFQLEMNRLAREAATRELLRDLYSPKQLQEQMTWFWVNHFNVHQHKNMIRAMVGDYEQQLRSHALGKFRDLLAASARHPAMLVYLDNAQNALNHVNENYARELLELHTLGVDGGYTQQDVQELARVLTGFGINRNDPAHSDPPRIRRELASQYVRNGLFEFNQAARAHPADGAGAQWPDRNPGSEIACSCAVLVVRIGRCGLTQQALQQACLRVRGATWPAPPRSAQRKDQGAHLPHTAQHQFKSLRTQLPRGGQVLFDAILERCKLIQPGLPGLVRKGRKHAPAQGNQIASGMRWLLPGRSAGRLDPATQHGRIGRCIVRAQFRHRAGGQRLPTTAAVDP